MTKPVFIAMPGNETKASRLAAMAQGEVCPLEMHTFPDGEVCPRLMQNVSNRSVAIVCTLNQPNGKVLPLVFAADAARQQGACEVGLIAPYLSYMRQDRRFHSGEAVTSRTFAALISRGFDWLVTVDPHLHRIQSLGEIYSIPTRALHAGLPIAAWIKSNIPQPFLIGPDEESRQWVEEVANQCSAPFVTLSKNRLGDRNVRIEFDHPALPDHATPVLLDDIVSSGRTVLETIRLIRPMTQRGPVVIAIHGVLAADAEHAILQAGARLVTSNSIAGYSAVIDLDPLIACGIAKLVGRPIEGRVGI